jgi:peptidoglycan/LPS O-acetylase OafA/YrhL
MLAFARIALPILSRRAAGATDHDVARPAVGASAGAGERLAALDGLRGVLAMMVLVAHYFGEVAHGIAGLTLAWIAIRMFFVLSGFLMANIILRHISSPNFFPAFYIRRACRTLPVYLVLLMIVFTAAHVFRDAPWMEPDRVMPLWSFLTFTQGFVMIARGDFGIDWLTPTWTLTVEEQFYLVAPLLCLLTARRYLLAVLGAMVMVSIGFRVVAIETDLMPAMAGLVILPAAMHSMFLGMIAALLLRSGRIDWTRWDVVLRVAPIACLGLVFAVKLADGTSYRWFELAGVPLVSVACALYLMAIVRNAPEAESLKGPRLGLLGRLSYSIYLLHMPVLGLMHGVVLGARPDIGTSAQLLVTTLAVPVALGFAWAVNRTIEQPMIAYGRRWSFSSRKHQHSPSLAPG